MPHTFYRASSAGRLLVLIALVGMTTAGLAFSRFGEGLQPSVMAADPPTTWVVTNTNDIGTGSLREMISFAWHGDTIAFAIPTSDPGYDPSTGRYTINLTSGHIRINTDVLIKGPGAGQLTVQRSTAPGTANFRIFAVTAPSQVTISGMTINNGVAAVNDSFSPQGGAIHNGYNSKLTVSDCVISNSSANSGGGGIFSIKDLTVIRTTISGNTSEGNEGGGGGIGFGGIGSTHTIINSTINDNSAANGGGLFTGSDSAINIINSTFHHNTARVGFGGGMAFNYGGNVNVFNTAVTGNIAQSGGGLLKSGPSGVLALRNSIISGNTAPTGPDIYTPQGSITSQGYNIIQNSTGGVITAGTGDQLGVDPLLSPLGDFGGPTKTHLLLSGSPAINAYSSANLPPDTPDLDGDGDTTEAIPYDQRGYARITNGAADIGPVEVGTLNYAVHATLGSGQNTPINSPFAIQLKVTVTESGSPQSGIPVTFTAPDSGASGTFAGSTTITTDSSGVAIAPVFTANGTAGSYQVIASIPESVPAAVFNLTNAKGKAQIVLGNLVQSYDGTPKPVSVTTTPAGLAVTVTYNGFPTPPTSIGIHDVLATLTDANYEAKQVSGTLTITKAATTTTVTVGNASFDGQPHGGTAVVTGPDGLNQSLPVTYAGRNGTSYGPTTSAPIGVGDYTASATYSGDSKYNGSSDTKNFQITKASQTITFNALADKTYGNPNFTVSATASSGLGVSFAATGQCRVSGVLVDITGAGSCTITASQAGNINYAAAPNVSRTFNIAMATTSTAVSSSSNPSDFGQSVTFTAKVTPSFAPLAGTVQFRINGASAGAPVAVNASGVATFSTSSLVVGSHTISADYSGDANSTSSTGSLFQVVKSPPTLSINDVTVTEGNSGTRNAFFTVSLSAPTALTVKVDLATADGTATAGTDYQATNGTLTFHPFETIKTFIVTLNGDTFNEADETFFVNLSNPQNATILRGQGKTTILNDDTPQVQLSSSSYSINEGLVNTPQGYGTLTVTVNRTGDRSAPATVQYFTSDQSGGNECNQVTGQASQRCDYAVASGTLRFAAGESAKTIQISIVNDGYVENTEFFSIRLQNPTGTALGVTNQATVTLLDNDTEATTGTNNPYLLNTFFVRMNYLDFLGREPDTEGWSTWPAVLATCGPEKGFLGAPPGCDRAHVSHGFIASPEFTERGYYMYRMYEVGLLRLPRYNEFVPDMAGMSGSPGSPELAQNTAQFAENFTAKQEFLNKYGDVSAPASASDFITRLEQNAGVTLPATTTTLPGQPQQYNRQELINKRLSGELTVGQTLRAFVEQKVVYDKFFERGFVTMQYFGYLKRDPDLNDPNLLGWTEWVFVFTNGGAQRGRPDIGVRDYHHLVFGFIYSEEYRKRFGQP